MVTCETATSTVTESENRRKEVKDAGKLLDVAAEELKVELKLGTETIARSGEALEKAKSERDEQNKEVEKKKAAFQRDQKDAQACLKEMESADSRVRADIRKISGEATKIAGEENQLAKELARRQQERDNLEKAKSKLADTKRNLEATRTKIEELKRNNNRLASEVKALEIQQLPRQLDEAKKKFQELSGQLENEKTIEKQHSVMLSAVARLKAEVEGVRSSCHDKASVIEKLRKEASKEKLVEFKSMNRLLISAAKKLDDRKLLQRILAWFKGKR